MTPELQSRILACHGADELTLLLPRIEFETDAGLIEWRVTPAGNAVSLTQFEHPTCRVRFTLFPREGTLAVEAVWDGDFCGEARVEDCQTLCDLVARDTLRRTLPAASLGQADTMPRAVVVRSAAIWAQRQSLHPSISVGDVFEAVDEDGQVEVSEYDVEVYELLDGYWRSGASPELLAMMKSRGPRWIFRCVAEAMLIAGRHFNLFVEHEIMPEDGLGGREFTELLILLLHAEGKQMPLPIVQMAAASLCRLWETFDSVEGRNSWLGLLTVLDEGPLGDVIDRLSD